VEVLWVGAGASHGGDGPCPACLKALEWREGDWACSDCGFARPTPLWRIEGSTIITPTQERITPDLRLPGQINVANAAMALAAAAQLGVDPEEAAPRLSRVTDVDGRYISVNVEGRDVRLLLGKNPASWVELIDLVRTSERDLVIVLNARSADGSDPSWIWDVPFEQLGDRAIAVGGERGQDMAARLTAAGATVSQVAEDPLVLLQGLAPGAEVDLVANYTAFQDLRARVVVD